MRAVTAGFRTVMTQQTLNVSRRFMYNTAAGIPTDRSGYPKNYGTITLDATKIVSGKVSINLINSNQFWNMFLAPQPTPPNLRQTATLELGLQVSGATEWVTFFTGILDESHFIRDYVNCNIRNKMVLMLQKQVTQDYYTGASPHSPNWNPADLVWDILTTDNVWGEMDNTANATNVDIDYTLWSQWKTDLAAVGLKIQANLTGQTIAHVLSRIAYLTNSVIFVRGDGKFVFFRYVPPSAIYLTFNDNNTHLQEVKNTFDYLLNNVSCRHGYNPAAGPPPTWAGIEQTTDATSISDYWEVAIIEEDIAIWHQDNSSAKEFCNRQVDRYKDPLEICYFESGVMGYLTEPGDVIYLTFNFFNYSVAIFEVRRVDFNLNTGKVRIEAVNTLTWAMGGFILDDIILGLLDKDYNPLF